MVSEKSLDKQGNIFAAIIQGPNKGIFTIKRSGTTGCNDVSQEPIIVIYLEIGSRGDLSAETPRGEIVKSADINLLAGHRHTDDGTGLPSDDAWSFLGSG